MILISYINKSTLQCDFFKENNGNHEGRMCDFGDVHGC